ncbi:MAG: hypothetical protein JJE23_04970 [Thermoleophilia bacterium]|nr:hypothetical protein [Thermoleophilia bacterium]
MAAASATLASLWAWVAAVFACFSFFLAFFFFACFSFFLAFLILFALPDCFAFFSFIAAVCLAVRRSRRR